MSRNWGTEVPNGITGGTGPWFVQLFGIPIKWTWQDLKDYVRQAASHVGHVAIYANGRATITLRKWDEALECFYIFSANKDPNTGRGVYVELWETTPNQAPRLIWKNKERLPVEATAAGRTVTAYVPQLSPPSMPTRQDVLAQQMASMQLYEQQVAAAVPPQPPCPSYTYQNVGSTIGASSHSTNVAQYQVPRAVQGYSVAAPPYSTGGHYYLPGSSRLPTNPDRGTVRTEYRGVFVSNLSYDTTEDDIDQLFSIIGKIADINYKQEKKTNSKGKTATRCKGSAVVKFYTAKDAESAIERINGRSFKGRELTVRFDTEGTPINLPPTTNGSSSNGHRSTRTNDDGTPLIVDGSIYGNSR